MLDLHTAANTATEHKHVFQRSMNHRGNCRLSWTVETEGVGQMKETQQSTAADTVSVSVSASKLEDWIIICTGEIRRLPPVPEGSGTGCMLSQGFAASHI